jgi:hypothetical protein
MHQEKKSSNDNTNEPQTARASNKNNNDVLSEKNNYILFHVSFQSTGGTNISSANGLSYVVVCLGKKEGWEDSKEEMGD